MAHRHPHSNKITVYHAAAPTCSWSWGYEGVMNRLRMIYGDQVDVKLMSLCVWENFEEYLKEYELDLHGLHEWEKEIAGLLGLPIATGLPREKIPDNVLPASLATMAAYRQGEEKGGRYLREILRRSCVEAQDVSKRPILFEAARSAGLDPKKFEKDMRDTKGLKKEYGSQGHGWPELPLSYFSLVVSDGKRHVLLEHAFDPALAEGAVDYLSGGHMKKRTPTDIVGYLKHVGPASTKEIERVFGLSAAAAKTKLLALERSGKVRQLELARSPHWASA